MATKLQLYNGSIRHLGEITLKTITDDVEVRYDLDDLWSRAVLHVMEEGLWNFCTKTTTMTDSGTTPIAGYASALTKPTDWLRTIAVSVSPYFTTEADYRDEGSYIHAQSPFLYIRYTVSTYTSDASIALWPESFCRALEAWIAFELCERLTQSSNKKEVMLKIYQDFLAKAKNKDAMNMASQKRRAGSWVRSMRGTSFSGDKDYSQLSPDTADIGTVGSV